MRFDRLGCFTYSHTKKIHMPFIRRRCSRRREATTSAEIMEVQSQISWELNQDKVGNTYREVIDRKEGNYFVGRTEMDSPDVDNEVLVDASKYYLKQGEFVTLKITEAADFDLYAEPVN